MKKSKGVFIITSLTEYYNSIDTDKFSIKKLLRFFYCIFRFFWILFNFIGNVISFIFITGIYWIFGKTCRGCIFLKKEHDKETKWCTTYHIKYNKRCRDYRDHINKL